MSVKVKSTAQEAVIANSRFSAFEDCLFAWTHEFKGKITKIQWLKHRKGGLSEILTIEFLDKSVVTATKVTDKNGKRSVALKLLG